MQIDLTGRTALVTGAGRGIGREIALKLAEAGASVVGVARSAADLDSLAAEAAGGRVTPLVEDVMGDTLPARIEAMDRLDILVNNAGGNRPMPMAEVDDDTLDHLIALNVRAVYRVARAAVRVMLRQGSGVVVNMSSQMGHVGSPNRTVYCMTKHAVEGLTKAMAVELAPQGIRTVAVAPTFVRTPLTEPMLADPGFAAMVMDMIPMRKIATTEDIAAAVVFLASDQAGMITGESLKVDGGWTAR